MYKLPNILTKNKGQTFTKNVPAYIKVEDPLTKEITLKQNGTTNIYDKIQEFKDECNINKQLEIVEMTETKRQFEPDKGQEFKEYDLTKLPKNLTDAKIKERKNLEKLEAYKKITKEKWKKANEALAEQKLENQKKELNEN